MAEDEQDTDVDIQDFILARELAEVYLLMDHISACQNKEIPKRIPDDPVFADSGKAWVRQICEIAWPPEQTNRKEDARNAARLIRAKDVLNKAASPATGGSIAFTLMLAGEARDPQSGSWWRRTLMWMADVVPGKATKSGHPADSGDGSGASALGWTRGEPPSRASLAALAYPSLARRAWLYRISLYALLGFLVAWLLVTCLLSWDVATGNSLLNRVSVLDAQVTTLQSAGVPSAPGSPQPGATQPAPPPPGPPKVGASIPQPLPADLPRLQEQRAAAMENLAAWMKNGGYIRQWLLGRMGGALEGTYMTPPPALPTAIAPAAPATVKTNAEWAAVLLGVLASNILPIFYGLLGAGAAIVRQVSAKMRDSILTPRDILLAYVQLALGAVIGACIGLFVNSDGTAASAQGGLLASVPLSGSALCFIAGFGVEGVFQGLESLIRRVFNLEPTRPATPT